MARYTKPLTEAQIKSAKPKEKNYKLYDGGGLYLLVTIKGSKLWNAKYRFEGKEKKASFGSYPIITLSQARQKLSALKRDIAIGIDPNKKKKENAQSNIKVLFKDVVQEYLNFKSNEVSFSYYEKQKRRLEIYVLPEIGQKNIDDITKGEIVDLIKSIHLKKSSVSKETPKYETSTIVFNLLNQIFRYAVYNDLSSNMVMQTLDKTQLIPKYEEEHFKAVTDVDAFRKIMVLIDSYIGGESTRAALLFIAFTGLRSANVRGLRWEWIDFKKRVIVFPKEVMKIREEFRLPITKRTGDILEKMKNITGQRPYVFCSMVNKEKQLSENTLGYALKRMGIMDHTPHGFRSAFSTIAHEKQKEHKFSSEVIESQLAHSIGSRVKKAYLRSDFLEERGELLVWWENFILGI
jgi:integrase